VANELEIGDRVAFSIHFNTSQCVSIQGERSGQFVQRTCDHGSY
jgi:hypothetical protein